jgi:superfamily II DNA or RNA helicase
MRKQFTKSGWDSLRTWQQDAMNRFIDFEDEKTFVLEASPGAGKSRFAAFASHYAIHNWDISHVIFIAPWNAIIKSVKDAFNPVELTYRDGFHYDKKRGILQSRPNVDVTLDTYAGFCNHSTVDVLEHWIERNGFRFMLILDEVHHTKTVGGKWGAYVERVAQLADKLLLMSGTYFRSDARPISFLEYENDKPKTHYSISYAQCVASRFTRQVAFRFHNPKIEINSLKTGKSKWISLDKIPRSSPKMDAAAKREVLDPNGVHVEGIIKEAVLELNVMRKKWSDAACLFVCKAGKSEEEERSIHAIESKVRSIAGISPVVVTSDDSSSRGAIDAFYSSNDPYLCAIRMVSEGVDIPRIRMVVFLTFTDSEMLFRQIVGRCVRYIDGKEDDTAALVLLPKFRVMAEFAERFEAEAKTGAMNLEVRDLAQTENFEGPRMCNQCGCDVCKCYVVLDSEASLGGGQIASCGVDEQFVERAKIIRDSSPAHQHANAIQLGDALQRSARMGANLSISNLSDARDLACKKVTRTIKTIAKHKYSGDWSAAWRNEIHEKLGIDKREIDGTWGISEINKLNDSLKQVLIEALQ